MLVYACLSACVSARMHVRILANTEEHVPPRIMHMLIMTLNIPGGVRQTELSVSALQLQFYETSNFVFVFFADGITRCGALPMFPCQ